MAISKEKWKRLVHIRKEMIDLFVEAHDIVSRSGNNLVFERAKAYWAAGIESYLDVGEFATRMAGCTMQDTIDALRPSDVDQETNEDDNE